MAYNWYQTRMQQKPVAVISMTKTVHGELVNAPQVITCLFSCCIILLSDRITELSFLVVVKDACYRTDLLDVDKGMN